MRWAEEVDLLEEEMRRILQFLRWRTGWWTAKVGQRGLPEGPQCEGETAYALRQAEIQSELADQFTEEWKALAELISQGRAGKEVDGAEESDEEGEEGASDEEDEPIPTLPARPLKSTYVDEVWSCSLAMVLFVSSCHGARAPFFLVFYRFSRVFFVLVAPHGVKHSVTSSYKHVQF
jgi:hypothetical protein